MKGIWKEFKAFAIKGNAIDLAVGVVIGAAFGSIVDSLVKDVIMPPLGLVSGGLDFQDKVITLREAAEGVNAVTINYGLFVNALLDFLIIAFAIFVVVRQLNKWYKEKPAEESPTDKDCSYCCSKVPIKAVKCPNCTSNLE